MNKYYKYLSDLCCEFYWIILKLAEFLKNLAWEFKWKSLEKELKIREKEDRQKEREEER